MSKKIKLCLLLACYFVSSSSIYAYRDDADMDASNTYQLIMNQTVMELEGNLGVELRFPVIHYNSSIREASSVLQSRISSDRIISEHELTTYSVSKTLIGPRPGWDYVPSSFPEACLIVPHMDLTTLTDLQVRAAIAHEISHCFQFQILGSLEATMELPDWIQEGTAAWIGESHVNGTDGGFSAGWWLNYFDDFQLFRRSYDAFPFFLHLQRSGVNVHRLARSILESGGETSEAWTEIRNQVSDVVMAEWSAGLFREPTWGDPWNVRYTREIFTPPTSHPRTMVDGGTLPQTFTGPRAHPKLFTLLIPRDQLVEVRMRNGVAAVTMPRDDNSAGETHIILDSHSKTFCWGTRCGCPTGGEASNVLTPHGGLVAISVTGLEDDFELVFQQGRPFCCGNSQGVDSRLIGYWEMDPNPVLEGWAPGSADLVNKGVVGNSYMTINADGSVSKSYLPMRMWARSARRPFRRASFILSGSWRACLETRSTGPDQGWLKFTNVTDSVSQFRSSSGGSGARVEGEWFQSALCIARPESTRCQGNYRILSENEMRVFSSVGHWTKVPTR